MTLPAPEDCQSVPVHMGKWNGVTDGELGPFTGAKGNDNTLLLVSWRQLNSFRVKDGYIELWGRR